MGDISDWTNDIGLEASFYEQDILDRGDLTEIYEAGLVDEMGDIDYSNPPGLINYTKKPPHNSTCPKCGQKLVTRTNKYTQSKFLGCSSFPMCRYSC